MSNYLNIAYYKFINIEDCDSLRDALEQLCKNLHLKGTILLATEGINSCLVGEESSLQTFMDFLHQDVRFQDVEFKKSYSSYMPFRRLIVKIKQAILPMPRSGIRPMESTGRYLKPLAFKEWLDKGEPIVLLDTRNSYEVELGTFRNAINPGIKEFKEFPDWVEKNFMEYKESKVVTFCTGGIRCEKATAFMQQAGFKEVYQIEGGILKYLEETAEQGCSQENHYEGDCFVFDRRVAVDKNLNQAPYQLCYGCWAPLSQESLASSLYKEGQHCPHCYKAYQDKQAQLRALCLENNQKALRIRQARSAQLRKQRTAQTSSAT